MIGNLLRRFQPAVLINAEGDELVFSVGEVEIRQYPALRVDTDGKVIEIGRRALPEQRGRLVHLFGDEPDSGDACKTFCRYNVLLANAGSVLRPRVLLHRSAIRRAFGPRAPDLVFATLLADGFSTEFVDAI